ncbi:hypothetical protein BTJ15_07055 [Lactobacillus delbrueckii subsp. bulgaricus]|nr:hypothetical protein [Lactobacillus delbrueckii subsp. bulgaricus]
MMNLLARQRIKDVLLFTDLLASLIGNSFGNARVSPRHLERRCLPQALPLVSSTVVKSHKLINPILALLGWDFNMPHYWVLTFTEVQYL